MSARPDCELCTIGEAPGALFAFDSASVVASLDEPVTSLRLVSRHHVREPDEIPGLSRRRFWEEAAIAARALREVTGASGISYAVPGTTPHVGLVLRPEDPDPSRSATRAELVSTLQNLADAKSEPSTIPDVTAVYDEMSQWWDANAEDGFYNAHYDRPAVLDLCGDIEGQRLLDIGCGSGLYLAELIARGADVVGVDGSAEQLSRARARVGPDIGLVEHDLEHPLSMLGDETFDGAVMPLVYHHVDNRAGLLSEVRRVLRPGGWLVLSTSHPTSDWLQSGGGYFAVERVDAVFDGFGGRWRVPFWRIPMGVLLDEVLAAGLVIDRLVEPVPTADKEAISPRMHRRLHLEPGFVVLRAHRPA